MPGGIRRGAEGAGASAGGGATGGRRWARCRGSILSHTHMTITGTVEAVNERGIRLHGTWLHLSQHRPLALPMRGALVTVEAGDGPLPGPHRRTGQPGRPQRA
jgi:hypothetical protein